MWRDRSVDCGDERASVAERNHLVTLPIANAMQFFRLRK